MRNKSDRLASARHLVAVVATPGVPIFELAIACEIFGVDRRDLTPDWYDFALVTPEADTTLSHGLAVRDSAPWETVDRADTIVVPACTDLHERAPVALIEALRRADARGARIASICSGAFALAEAGLLRGRRATTHWMHTDELAQRYPDVRVEAGVLYTHDHVWTSAGTAAGLDMCLELVRQDLGAAVANDVARRLVTPPHRHGGQAQFITLGPATGTDDWAALLDGARHHLAELTVAGMARDASLSERTLHRRFVRDVGMTPQAWIQRERLLAAQRLLEVSELTVAAIARTTGLGSATNLRQQFSRAFGTTPSAYRATFGTVAERAG